MLKKLRILLAVLCFLAFCLLFMDVSGVLAPYLAFLPQLQLVPALLAGSIWGVLGLAAVTLLFGRVYCSVLCPLGILQDGIHRCGGKKRYDFSAGKTWLRAASLALFMAALLCGVPLIFDLLEPYSAFGRIASTLLAPLWTAGNNVLALAAEQADSFLVAPVPLWQKGLSVLIGALLTLGIIIVLARRHGRLWCNTLCPVGAGLGLLSKYALFRPRITKESCTGCGRCAAVCKASCIDVKQGRVDASRCVGCFNCLDVCRQGALHWLPEGTKAAPSVRDQEAVVPSVTETSQRVVLQKKTDVAVSRRALLAVLTSGLLSTPALGAGKEDAEVPAQTRKTRRIRKVPITPAGSLGLSAFSSRCTGCQLCVSVCPNQALRTHDSGLGMLQPSLSFEHGFCRSNCVACSTVCPTGAIRPVSVAAKSAVQIGRAIIDPDAFIISTDKVSCTACARSCGAGAITLVAQGEFKRPSVDAERCTGCGACEYICPVRPLAAIHVEGNEVHRSI